MGKFDVLYYSQDLRAEFSKNRSCTFEAASVILTTIPYLSEVPSVRRYFLET